MKAANCGDMFSGICTTNDMQGIDRLCRNRCHHMVVIPIILFAAGHAKIHIPSAIDDAKLKYPLVKFTYGRPIGVHE